MNVLQRCVAIVMAGALASAIPVGSSADEPALKPGPWHYRSVPCVNTTVVDVHPRLGVEGHPSTKEDYLMTGVVVVFNTTLGSDRAEPGLRAAITHYQDEAGNTLMRSERKGDPVQVCFTGYPLPTAQCDPDKDDRGRQYRVYDYKRRASYAGMNSEHDCGGA